MKKRNLNLLINIILFILFLLMLKLFIDFSENMYRKYEGFTPKIRGIIRPNFRKTRVFMENFANKHLNNGIYYFTKTLRTLNLY